MARKTPTEQPIKARIDFSTTEKWILGGLGVYLAWIGKEQFAITSGHGRMEQRIVYNEQRVDKIVNEMPTLRHDVAAATINQPAHQVMVTTIPRRIDSTRSIATIQILDFDNNRATTRFVTLGNDQAAMFASSMIGMMSRSAPNAMSFADVAEFRAPDSARRLPVAIDSHSSFMLWSNADSVPLSAMAVILKADSTKTARITAHSGTWDAVIMDVWAHPKNYSLPRDSTPRKP
jgi:hypothetical protein